MVTFINVGGAFAESSNIFISADRVEGSGGSLDAPGNALIRIENQSPDFLRTGNVLIPENAGGRITFNGVPVTSDADLRTRSQSGNPSAYFTGTVTPGT